MKKCAIVIGASSGIGRSLVKILSNNGYKVGVAARRLEKLKSLNQELGGGVLLKQMDVVDTTAARIILEEMISELGIVDLIVIAAGIDLELNGMEWRKQKDVIDTNVRGCAALINFAFHYFKEKNSGQLATVSSVLAVRGNRRAPIYAASKAFITHYMQGLRQRVEREKLNIILTDLLPGYVETAMIESRAEKFWVSSPDEAAWGIFKAIERKKPYAYTRMRWRMLSWLIRLMPERLYNRL